MDIFNLIRLAGGLAFFLYGMHVMSGGLERMAGSKLQQLLKKMTSNPFKSLILGAGITIAIQSSSATTVMLVGLVNSGIMAIDQSAGVIMGSNIGTTLTAWLLSLVGLETGNFWLKMLKPENFSLIFALVGIIMIMMSKDTKKHDIGSILVGFAVLMYGMKQMSDAVSPLADMPEFADILTAFNNPILGVLTGAVITAVIQASAASIGILQALSLTGNITYGMAIPIIMGQNIGTCVTALISSIGVNKNAKKVAVIHILFNVIGTVIFLSLYLIADAAFDLAFSNQPISSGAIALVHSVFNVATTVVLFPFSKQLVKCANTILRDKNSDELEKTELIDERLIATPSIAINECDNATSKMAHIASESLNTALDSISGYSITADKKINEFENMLDKYEDKLGTTLVKLSSQKLSDADSHRVSKMLHSIGDFERLGDHAVGLLKVSKELYEKKISFSDVANSEIRVLIEAVREIIEITISAYEHNSPVEATKVEPLEQVVDAIVATMKGRHIKRLQQGQCSIELGFILTDLLNNCARISDHCSNVAVSIIEIAHDSFDTHKYLNDVRHGNKYFNDIYDSYLEKYKI